MKPLLLDFQRNPSTVTSSGVVILALALLVAGQLIDEYRDLSTEIEHSKATLTHLKSLYDHKEMQPAKKADAQYAMEVMHANEMIDQLAIPWDGLFAAVEGAAEKDVALLTIQPDRNSGVVTIGGEARNIAAMLDYIRRLDGQKPLKDVVLLSHQIQQQDPQKPVRFTINAKWMQK